jgi:hypothetical protein
MRFRKHSSRRSNFRFSHGTNGTRPFSSSASHRQLQTLMRRMTGTVIDDGLELPEETELGEVTIEEYIRDIVTGSI